MTPENREYFEQSREASGVPLKVKNREVLADAAAMLRGAARKPEAGEQQ